MTTIVTDGKTIAADGRALIGFEITSATARKLRFVQADQRQSGMIVAFCGSAPLMDAVCRWLVAGAEPHTVPRPVADSDGWSALVLTAEAPLRRITSGVPHFEQITAPFGDGSGGDAALAAVLAGRTPREAVAIVASRWTHTGGEIVALDIARTLAEGREVWA